MVESRIAGRVIATAVALLLAAVRLLVTEGCGPAISIAPCPTAAAPVKDDDAHRYPERVVYIIPVAAAQVTTPSSAVPASMAIVIDGTTWIAQA